MNVHHIAMDVLREALARRFVAVVGGIILLMQLGLVLTLDLDVVEGVLVGSRLLGNDLGGGSGSEVFVDAALEPLFHGLVRGVFIFGTLFGLVATSDIAARLLAPGRVELLLALPVRRWELVVGIYVGVLILALSGTLFAIGGFATILFFKAGFASLAPFIGAACVALAFMSVYAAMLLTTTLVRSPALASGTGLCLFIAAMVTSDRAEVLSWFQAGWSREVARWLIAPLPRLMTVAELSPNVVAQAAADRVELWSALGGTFAFAAAVLAAAVAVVVARDY